LLLFEDILLCDFSCHPEHGYGTSDRKTGDCNMGYVITILCCVFFSSMAWADPAEAGVKSGCPQLTGRVVMPTDAQYEKARLVSNYYSSMDSRPKAIVYCQNVQDVQNAVKWARCHHVPIRIRSGGHNHEGFSTGTDVVVIDVSEMKKVQVDKEKGVATVQPGITGGELYHTLFKEGLTQVGGTCEDVGISGLVLTGGMGPLARIKGLTCDTLVSFDMVDAHGNVITATADNEHKNLFWAACGGGAGNFGVLTSITLKVYPAKQVTWFNIGWNWDQPIEEVIAQWQKFFLNGDRRWFSHLDLWSKPFPSEKFDKQPVNALGVCFGTPVPGI
jgi:FAD/FMN-containing dehydrogenase